MDVPWRMLAVLHYCFIIYVDIHTIPKLSIGVWIVEDNKIEDIEKYYGNSDNKLSFVENEFGEFDYSFNYDKDTLEMISYEEFSRRRKQE